MKTKSDKDSKLRTTRMSPEYQLQHIRKLLDRLDALTEERKQYLAEWRQRRKAVLASLAVVRSGQGELPLEETRDDGEEQS